MWWNRCKRKCEKCERYKNKYITQKKRIDQLEEYIESILKTQKDIVELMEQINEKR